MAPAQAIGCSESAGCAVSYPGPCGSSKGDLRKGGPPHGVPALHWAAFVTDGKCGCRAEQAVPDHVSQEPHSEEVVGDVARAEQQPPVGAPPLRGGQGDLAVLHHAVQAVHPAHHAHRLRGVRLLHHLPQGRGQEGRGLKRVRLSKAALALLLAVSLRHRVKRRSPGHPHTLRNTTFQLERP